MDVIEKTVLPYGNMQNDGFLGGGGIGSLLIGALLFGGGRGFGGWGNNWGGQGGWSDAAKTDVVLNPAFQSLQTQIQGLSGQVNNNAILDQINNGFSGIDAGITSINQNISGTSRDTLNSIANLSTAQAAGNFTTLQSINGLGRDVTAQANQNALQQLNSFNVLTTSVLQGFNGQAMQTQNATNQIIAQGSALSSQLAACCCEIQSKIASDGDSTRALINSINLQNIQTQLNDAKNQISNLNQTQTLISALARRCHHHEEVS